jgi:uncharacterized protein (TIGR02246 family)
MRISCLAAACFVAAMFGSTSAFAAEPGDRDEVIAQIQDILRTQQEAWNRGDVEAFLDGYWNSEDTVFVSGDEVTRGWKQVLERYKRTYSDRTKMGALTFSDLQVTPLSDEAALAVGRWSLQRKKDQPHGRFTLILKKFPEGWKIIHDHTSTGENETVQKQERQYRFHW